MDVVPTFEVCSPGEFRICERVGVPMERIVLSGVYKNPEDMEYVLSTYGGKGVYTVELSLIHIQMCIRDRYKNGKCATNETVGGIKFNKNGYASNLTQARCKLAARNFIARHSNANASNYEKFRSCFYYIMAYTNFVGYMDPTPQEFKTKDWVYKYSLQMFQNGLTGNCYGIASSVAAIAKELGYEPYVITIPDGHSFVMINGLYYDNMYGTLFGAATRPAYTIEHKIKF